LQRLWRRGMLSTPCEQNWIIMWILIDSLDCGLSCLRPGSDLAQRQQHGLR
jgi:hypothetical protein